jgi:hypothetical protein
VLDKSYTYFAAKRIINSSCGQPLNGRRLHRQVGDTITRAAGPVKRQWYMEDIQGRVSVTLWA